MANSDMLGIGISGLLAFQRALGTTSHNINNVNTPGFSRQRTELVTQPPQFAGNGYIGSGVQVDSVRRVYDEFIGMQVRAGTSSFKQLESFHALAAQIDTLLADGNSGLMSALQGFFDAVQQVANDPTSTAARQLMLANGSSLVERFHALDTRMRDLESQVNLQVRNTVSEINTLAKSIAGLNQDIALAQGNGQPPNDLLDRRDEAIRQLAERVAVTTVKQDDGSVNVFIGNGQTLVVGNRAMALSATANAYNSTQLDVGYTVGSSTINITDQLSGGVLGGALQFRAQVLDPAVNALGRVAAVLSSDFNNQHRLGMDLDGNLGGDFFKPVGPMVLASTANAGAGSVTGAITNAGALEASDYRLRYDGANAYTLTRLSDQQTFAINTGGTSPYTTATIDGFNLTITAGAAVGDSFLMQPVRTAGAAMSLALADGRSIAAAAPIRTEAGFGNAGSGTISAGTVNGPAPPNANLQQAVTITFDNPPTTFDVTGTGTGNPTNVAYAAGGNISYNGWTLQISGTPVAGDTFTVRANTNGVSDNRNALLLTGLQTGLNVANGTASYEGAYGQLLAGVGVSTHAADINREAQQTLLNQSIAARESVSGVNLDEEAANLVRFQQAYQAAAQVIATADSLFETLLGVVRR